MKIEKLDGDVFKVTLAGPLIHEKTSLLNWKIWLLTFTTRMLNS